MGWRLLRRLEKRGRANENYEKEVDEIYELDSADDFDAFLVSLKRKGGTLIERRGGLTFYFTVDSVEVERRAPTASGRVQVVATVCLSLLKESTTTIPPWELAPYNFRVTTTLVDESTNRFYPGVGDVVFPRGSYAAQPFVNTAGAPLDGESSYATSKIYFSYNAPVDAFDPRLLWAPLGKVNLYATTVCGMTFPPRTLRLEALNAEFSSERVESRDASGAEQTIVWKFYRIDVALLANPRSFDRLYWNVGAHVLRAGSLRRLWSWTDPTLNVQRYGTYADYLTSNARDGEQVSENVSLTSDGAGVSPVPTYRLGSPFEPVDFAGLNLPTQGPTKWQVVDP